MCGASVRGAKIAAATTASSCGGGGRVRSWLRASSRQNTASSRSRRRRSIDPAEGTTDRRHDRSNQRVRRRLSCAGVQRRAAAAFTRSRSRPGLLDTDRQRVSGKRNMQATNAAFRIKPVENVEEEVSRVRAVATTSVRRLLGPGDRRTFRGSVSASRRGRTPTGSSGFVDAAKSLDLGPLWLWGGRDSVGKRR